MSQQISALRTKRIITEVRLSVKDAAYKLFQTDEEICLRINKAVDEICRTAKCLYTTATFLLEPDRDIYDSTVIGFPAIIQSFVIIDRVYIIDGDGNQVGNDLKATTPAYIVKYKTERSETIPAFYAYDHSAFRIWKPYSTAGYRIAIEGKRTPLEEEEVTPQQDPVIPYIYDKAIAAGAAYHLILSDIELQKMGLQPAYFKMEFEKYRDYASATPSSSTKFIHSNELNL